MKYDNNLKCPICNSTDINTNGGDILLMCNDCRCDSPLYYYKNVIKSFDKKDETISKISVEWFSDKIIRFNNTISIEDCTKFLTINSILYSESGNSGIESVENHVICEIVKDKLNDCESKINIVFKNNTQFYSELDLKIDKQYHQKIKSLTYEEGDIIYVIIFDESVVVSPKGNCILIL